MLRKIAPYLFSMRLFFPLSKSLRGKLQLSPFFVFGSGRNGSTLLNRILNQHPELYLPTEQYFLPSLIYRYVFYNHLPKQVVAKKLEELVNNSELQSWRLENTMQLDWRPLDEMIDKVFRTQGKLEDSIFWGDTTPVNTPYLRDIFKVFPKAKYIFLLRDGRDVVASYQKDQSHFSHLPTLESQVKFWLNAIWQYDWLRKKTSVKIVRYEDLVKEPNQVIEELFGFLGMAQSKDWQSYHQIPDDPFFGPEHHRKIRMPLTTDSIGKWEELLSPAQISYCKKHIYSSLDKFGYQL